LDSHENQYAQAILNENRIISKELIKKEKIIDTLSKFSSVAKRKKPN
jgi:hypothetical protein